ncbi:MAG TPA: response regulator [Marmoricola sp.]|nr:response regulator [Marmoricola sp.]
MTGRTILVVDDDDEIREITCLALELMGGWKVVSADRGATCLQRAREDRPHVILLDVMMPEMDGPTTFVRLQQDPLTRHIPVILLTAKARVGDNQCWDGLDIAGVISKPFNPTTLSDEVDRLVEEHVGESRLSA